MGIAVRRPGRAVEQMFRSRLEWALTDELMLQGTNGALAGPVLADGCGLEQVGVEP